MKGPQRFRKRPVVIEASDPIDDENADEIAGWCGGRVERMPKPSDPADVYFAVKVPTLEGPLSGSRGDRIIRGVKGEFYPCKPDVFDATYEPVR